MGTGIKKSQEENSSDLAVLYMYAQYSWVYAY